MIAHSVARHRRSLHHPRLLRGRSVARLLGVARLSLHCLIARLLTQLGLVVRLLKLFGRRAASSLGYSVALMPLPGFADYAVVSREEDEASNRLQKERRLVEKIVREEHLPDFED
jgi:hypothetical protein